MKIDLAKKFFTIEVLFVLLAFLNIWPIWFSDYFPTVDGPSHLYNSQLILDLLKSDSFFADFLEINSEWVPNWTGHFLLLLFQKMGFSVFFANKIVLSLIALGIPLAFKRLLKILGSPITGISFFSLIFVYTFLFGMGFYNFGLGIFMTLVSIQFYLKSKENTTFRNRVLLFLSIGLCFFSHLVCFGILCLYFLIDFLLRLINNQRRSLISHGIITFLCSLPFVVLSALFFMGREAPDASSYFGAATLWTLFTHLKILVLYFGETEILLAQIVFYLLMVYCLISLLRIRAIGTNFKPIFVLVALLLGLFFIMPDAGSNGSFISRRILIFAFWFLFIALSPMFNFRWLNFSLVLLVVSIQSFRTINYHKELKEQELEVSQLLAIAEIIEEGSIVLDIWKGEGFKKRHFSSYMALDKEILILDNYEANYGYFPVKWKEDFPRLALKNSQHYGEECLKWNNNPAGENEFLIDYVLLYGDQGFKPCESDILVNMEDHYEEIYPLDAENPLDHIRLLKRKL